MNTLLTPKQIAYPHFRVIQFLVTWYPGQYFCYLGKRGSQCWTFNIKITAIEHLFVGQKPFTDFRKLVLPERNETLRKTCLTLGQAENVDVWKKMSILSELHLFVATGKVHSRCLRVGTPSMRENIETALTLRRPSNQTELKNMLKSSIIWFPYHLLAA